MSFPRYPSYKDSFVDWLGEVPEHWEVTRTKRVTTFTTGWTPPTGDQASFVGDNLWANISDLGPRCICDTAKRISDEAVAASRVKVSPAGSLLFSFKLSIGQVSFAGRDMYTNEAIATFVASARLDLGYAYYALPVFLLQNAAENIYGAKLLNQELMRAAPLVLPSRGEQVRIAAFLDHETENLDALIAEQQRLIELLKEKRQALISHAVTKGLNPDAPMKPSGIEWLGDVPAHWETQPLKRSCLLIRDGTHLPPPRVAAGIPLLSVRNVINGEFARREDDSMISEESYAELCRSFTPCAGDVLLAIVGATLGKTAIVPEHLGRFHIQRSLAAFRPAPEALSSRFLNLLFQASPFQSVLWQLVSYSAQPGIYLGTLANIWIPLPSIEEQAAIEETLSSQIVELVALVAEADRAIALLQERRTAIISAVITGKIDVQTLVGADAEAA